MNVFEDLDGDGVRDANEPGIGGIRIDSESSIEDGRVSLPKKLTGSNGIAKVSNAVVGKYRLKARETVSYYLDGFVHADVIVHPGRTTKLDIPMRHDEGNASLAVRPFRDRDGDLVRRAGEPGLPAGTTVSLRKDGQAIASAVTGADGVAHFDHLRRGQYDFDLINRATDALGYPYDLPTAKPVTLRTGEQRDVNMSIHVAPTVTGVVFRDDDHNGVRNGSEPLVPNAYINLEDYVYPYRNNAQALGVDDNGTQADGQAHYSLRLPVYDFHSSMDQQIALYAVVAGGNYRFYETTLQRQTSRDFTLNIGLIPSVSTASISLQGFIDTDENGSRNGAEVFGRLPSNLRQQTDITLTSLSDGRYYSDTITGEGLLRYSLTPGQYRLTFNSAAMRRRITDDALSAGLTFTLVAGEAKQIGIGVTAHGVA